MLFSTLIKTVAMAANIAASVEQLNAAKIVGYKPVLISLIHTQVDDIMIKDSEVFFFNNDCICRPDIICSDKLIECHVFCFGILNYNRRFECQGYYRQ